MKKIAIGAIAALMLTTAAQAADKKIGATVSSLEFTFIVFFHKIGLEFVFTFSSITF